MKKVMLMFSIVLMFCLSVNAAIVDTNFDYWYQQNGGFGDWGGQVDPASNATWTSNSSGNDYGRASWAPFPGKPDEGTSEPIGFIRSQSGGSYAQLHFGDASNNGIYTVTWWQVVNDKDVSHPDEVGRTGFYAEGWAELTVVKMDDANGKIYVTTNSGDVELLSSMSDNTWYEYEMTANIPAHTFTIKVKQGGASDWEAIQENLTFKDGSGVSSFAILKCYIAGGGSETKAFLNGYDDIKVEVVPEPAALALLGLGAFFASKKQ